MGYQNIVAADLADKCEIQLSYAIGVVEPTSVKVDTFGTGKVDEFELAEAVKKVFDLTPRGIEEHLNWEVENSNIKILQHSDI